MATRKFKLYKRSTLHSYETILQYCAKGYTMCCIFSGKFIVGERYVINTSAKKQLCQEITKENNGFGWFSRFLNMLYTKEFTDRVPSSIHASMTLEENKQNNKT